MPLPLDRWQAPARSEPIPLDIFLEGHPMVKFSSRQMAIGLAVAVPNRSRGFQTAGRVSGLPGDCFALSAWFRRMCEVSLCHRRSNAANSGRTRWQERHCFAFFGFLRSFARVSFVEWTKVSRDGRKGRQSRWCPIVPRGAVSCANVSTERLVYSFSSSAKTLLASNARGSGSPAAKAWWRACRLCCLSFPFN